MAAPLYQWVAAPTGHRASLYSLHAGTGSPRSLLQQVTHPFTGRLQTPRLSSCSVAASLIWGFYSLAAWGNLSDESAEIECAAQRSSYWTGEVMMKLQIQPGRVQRLKCSSHETFTASRRNDDFRNTCVYKAAFHVQWKLHALYEDDPNLQTVIQLRHVVN